MAIFFFILLMLSICCWWRNSEYARSFSLIWLILRTAALSINRGDYSDTANTAQESRESRRSWARGISLKWIQTKILPLDDLLVRFRDLGVFMYFFLACFLVERVSTHTLIVSPLRHCLRDFRISAFRSLILDWSSAVLLLKILLLCEVCTLLLQMETLQSRHLPAQMDWLSVSCVRRQQNQSVVHLCAPCGMEGHQMA